MNARVRQYRKRALGPTLESWMPEMLFAFWALLVLAAVVSLA